MKFDVVTLFPEMFGGFLSESIIKRAIESGKIDVNLHQLRDFATDKHKTVDDTPCGGGAGMVIKVNIVDLAISKSLPCWQAGKCQIPNKEKSRTILLTPTGKRFDQRKAIELSKYENIILVCGHYEGFDQRVHDHLVDEELSIGDFVLTGGELPAMVVIDAVSRMIPGVINEESAKNESFMNCKKLDYPVYTRPIEYKGWRVPEVLLSGDHKKVEEWRRDQVDAK